MRSVGPALLPIFRSRHQAEILAAVLLHPGREYTLTNLARAVGVPLTTAHRETQRLVEAGILTGRAVGRSRLLRANTDHRVFAPLAQLLMVSFGPQLVVAEEFADLDGARLVLIYGSWAARYHGHPGGAPADIDVLVVGSPARAAVYAAAERAEERLGLAVNPTVRAWARWEEGDDPLVSAIRSAPLLVVWGEPEGSAVVQRNDQTPVKS